MQFQSKTGFSEAYHLATDPLRGSQPRIRQQEDVNHNFPAPWSKTLYTLYIDSRQPLARRAVPRCREAGAGDGEQCLNGLLIV